MIFNMSVLYLTNSSDDQIRAYSYKVFSLILAIFCALLIEKAQHHCVIGVVNNLVGDHAGNDAVMVLIFIPWYLGISVSCKKFEHHPAYLYSVSEGIITHVAAFVGIEMLADPQRHIGQQISDSVGPAGVFAFYAGTLVLIILLTVMLNMITSRIRKMAKGNAQDHSHGHVEEP